MFLPYLFLVCVHFQIFYFAYSFSYFSIWFFVKVIIGLIAKCQSYNCVNISSVMIVLVSSQDGFPTVFRKLECQIEIEQSSDNLNIMETKNKS